jgi:mannose-1-phosphate guanylyltransferase
MQSQKIHNDFKAFEGFTALLLAAGEGKRLRPITQNLPKCLVKIDDIPLLGIWLETLFGNGIERVIINTHYLKGQVDQFCATSKYSSKIDLMYEPNLLGSVGTLLQNKGKISDNFLLAHADNLTIFNPRKFVENFFMKPSCAIGTMMTFETDDPQSCGIVDVDKDDMLTGYYQKVINPPSNTANAAVFLLDKNVYKYINKDVDFDFCSDVIPKLIGKMKTYKNDIYHRDIGTCGSLRIANVDFRTIQKKSSIL